MKKIYLVAPFFPPNNHTASNRLASFAKYLDKKIGDVVVVVKFSPERNVLVIEKEFDIKIIQIQDMVAFDKLPLPRFAKNFCNKVSGYWQWLFPYWKDYFFLLRAGRVIGSCLDASPSDSILITSSAPISHIKLGCKLKRKYRYLHWISDVRDEISKNPFLPFWSRFWGRMIEKEMILMADTILSVSAPILNHFRAMSCRKEIKFLEIRNGYDFVPEISQNRNTEKKVLKIAYAGSFYGAIRPTNFFKALDKVSTAQNGVCVEVNIFGGGGGALKELPSNIKVNFFERINYSDLIRELRKMDLLLLIHPVNGRKGVFTSKLFDYIAIDVPIFAAVDRSDVAADLIRECNAGYIANENDIDAIVFELSRFFSMYIRGEVIERKWSVVYENSRLVQVRKLSEHIWTL